jgi:hypothetical protein
MKDPRLIFDKMQKREHQDDGQIFRREVHQNECRRQANNLFHNR